MKLVQNASDEAGFVDVVERLIAAAKWLGFLKALALAELPTTWRSKLTVSGQSLRGTSRF